MPEKWRTAYFDTKFSLTPLLNKGNSVKLPHTPESIFKSRLGCKFIKSKN